MPVKTAIYGCQAVEKVQLLLGLSDDERELLCLYYYHELSMEGIGKQYGVTKMAISKRLRKIHDQLRSLMIHEAP